NWRTRLAWKLMTLFLSSFKDFFKKVPPSYDYTSGYGFYGIKNEKKRNCPHKKCCEARTVIGFIKRNKPAYYTENPQGD
ncbi:MAG: hypothetical protein AAB476_03275, partial [Patescibacteria group bacterium]